MRFKKVFVIVFLSLGIANASDFEKDETIKLTLDSLIQEVVRKNPKGLGQLIEYETKNNELKAQKAIFEPNFTASVSSARQKSKTSPEDSYYNLLTNSDNLYESKSKNYEVGFNALIPTGGQWELKLVQNSLSSNVIEKTAPNDTEHRSYLKLGLQQPLLKNGGLEVTYTQEKLAKIQSEISKNEYENILTELIGVTIQTYWQLYGAQKVLQSWEKLISVTRKNLETIKDLANSGKIPQTEIYEIQNRLYLIELQRLEAKDKLIEKQNQILSLLNLPVSRYKNIQLEHSFPISNNHFNPTFEEVFESALANWSEYKKAQKQLEVEKTTLKYLQNQLLPELNLKADVTNQSLENSSSKAFQEVDSSEYQAWNIGLEFSLPLYGNEKMKNYEKNARLKALRARLELNALEKNLQNSLHTRIQRYQSTKEQIEVFEKGVQIKKDLVAIEEEKLSHGKTDLKTLLEQKEELVEYERKMYERLVEYKTAEAILQKVMGKLLLTYNITVDVKNLEQKVQNDAFSDQLNFK